MFRSKIQSATALSEAGNGKNVGIHGLLARKRLREGSGSPSRPRKKAGGLRHTPHGFLSGCNGLQPFASTAGPSHSSNCSSSTCQGSILSPPYQPYDVLPANRENSCFTQTTAPAIDTVNGGAALGTPPCEETALNECYQPIVPYDTGSLPVVNGSLSSAAPALEIASSVWPTVLDQLPCPPWFDTYSQDPNVEAVSSYTADLIALGHSNSSPTATYSSGLTSDTLTGYQNFPAARLSEHQLQLCASQPAPFDVVGQNELDATPEITVPDLNFGLPMYPSPFFGDQTATSLLQPCPGPPLDQEQLILLIQGGYTQDTFNQLSSSSASPEAEALLFKTSQSPESKGFLDDVPLKTEQRSPSREIVGQTDPSPEPVKSIYGFHATTQGPTDQGTIESFQNGCEAQTKLDPLTELQLVHQCFNPHGRSFALVREPFDASGPPTKSVVSTQGQKTRKPLREDERQETSRTRDVGACVRCKIQRVRCKPNLDEPEGPCQACIKVARNRSQKRIHNIGCHRYKLQEVSLFRTTRLRYTKRWQGAQIRDVPTFGDPVTIWIYQGLATPLAITVRRYEFSKMDPRTIVARKWADPHGAYREQSDYPYALANVNETKDWYREYITAHKFEAYNRMIYHDTDAQWEGCDSLIKDIYRLAHEDHYDQLPTGARCNFYRPPEKWDAKQISEENFMAGIFEMWFAMRQATGSSYVRCGDSELDPADGDVRPGNGWTALTSLSTPKMVVGQFNSINITCVLRPLAKVLLKVLMSWIADRHYNRWMSIFYATFIVLREISHTTFDAYLHGARNPEYDSDGPLKPNWPENIVELHESANIILAHWHYFNCSTDPINLNDKARAKSPLKKLSDEQLRTVQGIWSKAASYKACYKEDPSATVTKYVAALSPEGSYGKVWPAWCHPLYFAGQMFDVDWRPKPVFHE